MGTIGDRNAPYHIAERLLKARRNKEAFEIYRKLAGGGDPNSQVFLGWMLSEGIGTTRNPDEAFRWFKQAASVGSARGAYACANHLLVQKKYSEAIPYLREAARTEFSPAVLWLGICYLNGRGVEQDIQKGLRLIEDAARLGNWMAKRKVATLKMEGRYGALAIVAGVLTLPVLIVRGLISLMIQGHSEKFMG